MNTPKNKYRILAFGFALLLMLSGCSIASEKSSESLISAPPSQVGGMEEMALTMPPTPPTASGDRPTRPVTTTVTLSDTGIQIEGIGAQANGGVLTITSDGVYEINANGYIFIDGGTLRLSSPPRPSYEGALLCNGDVTFTGGNVALVGNVGVGVIAESQPLLLVSHPIEQTGGEYRVHT